jgi:sugar phosphate isomerase/epimerase
MKLWLSFFVTIILLISCTQKNQQETVANKGKAVVTDYQTVKIKPFPIAVQCWTFRKFTFFETLQKVKDLGIKYLEAYPGQALSSELPDVRLDHNLSDDQLQLVKNKLNELGITLVNYGVVDLGRDEASMSKVFDFAKKMGITTIMAEPEFEDFPLVEKLVQQYNIKVAVHNHPQPSRYALPDTVLKYVKNLDQRIGSCADTGHWLRSGVVPVEALRLLKGRILSTHLKDLNEFGVREAYDVPFGQGVANIHDILAELTLQDYQGYLVVEHENEAEVMNPSPSISTGLEYIKRITSFEEK